MSFVNGKLRVLRPCSKCQTMYYEKRHLLNCYGNYEEKEIIDIHEQNLQKTAHYSSKLIITNSINRDIKEIIENININTDEKTNKIYNILGHISNNTEQINIYNKRNNESNEINDINKKKTKLMVYNKDTTRGKAQTSGIYCNNIDKNDPVIQNFIKYYIEIGRYDSECGVRLTEGRLKNILGFLQKEELGLALDKLDIKHIKAKYVIPFFTKLYSNEFQGSGVNNYIRNFKVFLIYVISGDFDEGVKDEMKKCKNQLDMITIGCNKQKKKDTVNKQHNKILHNKIININDIQQIIYKQKLLKEINRIIKLKKCTKKEYLIFTRYLFAIITLKYYQRPGVVSNMKVTEFLNPIKKNNVRAVYVKDHNTGTTYPAVVLFTLEEYNVVLNYYNTKRPTSTSSKLFIRFNGSNIENVGKEVNRIQTEYKCKTYNATDARKAIETLASKNISNNNPIRTIITDLLTHSLKTAQNNYVQHNIDKYIEAQDKIVELTIKEQDEDIEIEIENRDVELINVETDDNNKNNRNINEITYHYFKNESTISMDKLTQKDIELWIIKNFNIDNKEINIVAKRIMTKNRTEIIKINIKNTISLYKKPPTNKDLEKLLKIHKHKMVTHKYITHIYDTTHTQNRTTHNKIIQNNKNTLDNKIINNKWENIIIKDTDRMGKGLYADRDFEKGEVICEYEGTIKKGKKAKKYIKKTINTEYMLMFRHNELHYIIDGQFAEDTSFGRNINHSKKKYNTKPFIIIIDNNPRVVFKCIKDVAKGDEFKFDYNDNRIGIPDWLKE